MNTCEIIRSDALTDLCKTARELVSCGEYDRCMELLCSAMSDFPHAPQPHNLLGLLLEKIGNHACAMKHFRAAWALDPSYQPANQNLTYYGTFCSGGRAAFDFDDCPRRETPTCTIEYDARGIGHVVRRR